MRLRGFNGYWNRWDEIYDLPYIRHNWSVLRVKVPDGVIEEMGETVFIPTHFNLIQRGNYSHFEEIPRSEPDSLKIIFGDICFELSVWLWLIKYSITAPIMVKYNSLLDKLSNFASKNK